MDQTMKTRIELAVIIALGAFVLFAPNAHSEAYNELYQSVPVTPDIAVSAGATLDVALPGVYANWVYIKNDCVGDLYFDLTGASVAGGSKHYPLRLLQNQSFTGSFQVYSIGVSPGNGSASGCTFTLVPGR